MLMLGKVKAGASGAWQGYVAAYICAHRRGQWRGGGQRAVLDGQGWLELKTGKE